MADALYAEGRGGQEPVKRRDLRFRLATEQLTGVPEVEDWAKPAHVLRGIEEEAAAFAAFEAETGLVATSSGFVSMTNHLAGSSLDGHVGAFDAILEIKNPKSKTQLDYIRADEVPPLYVPQMTHNLWVTGARTCYFLSFDRRLIDGLRVFLKEFTPPADWIEAYAERALEFLDQVRTERMAMEELARARQRTRT